MIFFISYLYFRTIFVYKREFTKCLYSKLFSVVFSNRSQNKVLCVVCSGISYSVSVARIITVISGAFVYMCIGLFCYKLNMLLFNPYGTSRVIKILLHFQKQL